MSGKKYKAFISYSHSDDRWARWLHRRLENYRLPKNIIGKDAELRGAPPRLRPIFRDREELAASNDLGEKIESALSQSESLIVICSPKAAQSHWVNEEILLFKHLNPDASIFSIIVEGEPYASNIKGRETDEAFPPALRFKLGNDGKLSDTPAEPLAADLREAADGKRLGLLKLVSGLIGVGLDEIVQRDMQKNRRRVIAITSSALATILVMGTLTGFALYAKQDADEARSIAQARTTSAEELIEFMVTDLKVKLDAVGRLDALQVVGEKASDYYDEYPLSSHDDNALGQRARVFHFLGEIQTQVGSFDKANIDFIKAYRSTEALLKRSPDNPDRLYDHAQSAYWAAYAPMIKKEYETAETYYQEYVTLSETLMAIEPDKLRSLQEQSYAYLNMGVVTYRQNKLDVSFAFFHKVLPNFQRISQTQPVTLTAKLDLANLYAWLSDCTTQLSQIDAAIDYRKQQYELLLALEREDNNNAKVLHAKLTSALGLISLYKVNETLAPAKTLLDINLSDSEALWMSDQKNSEWLENYIWLLLQKAEIAKQQGDTTTLQSVIETYRNVYETSQVQNENTDMVFETSEPRYAKLLSAITAQNLPINPERHSSQH